MPKQKLTDKQKLFCKEYLKDRNATRAAKASGYSEKTAQAIGAENLTKPLLRAYLDKNLEKQMKRVEIDADYVLRNIKEVAERCMQAIEVVDAEGKPTGKYVFKENGALKALELLGKNQKLFTDKFEHSGEIDINVVTYGSTDTD